MLSERESELPLVAHFRTWLADNGVRLHPAMYYVNDPVYGLSIFSHEDLKEDSTVITVPAGVAITPYHSQEAVLALLGLDTKPSADAAVQGGAATSGGPIIDDLKRHDWVVLYLVLHELLDRLLDSDHTSERTQGRDLDSVQASPSKRAKRASSSGLDDAQRFLRHGPYVRLLPQSYQTPLHFSDAELALLQGTPLLSAAIDRRETTKAALEKARRLFEHGNGNGIGKTFLHLMDSLEKEIPGYALDLWRRMETAYDSRAFPPQLVASRPPGSSPETEEAQHEGPTLIPGLDTFNHARAHRVTWAVSSNFSSVAAAKAAEAAEANNGSANTTPLSSADPSSTLKERTQVSLKLQYAVPAGTQVFNNYGAKGNEELLGTYGFVLPGGLDDSVILRLAQKGLSDGSNSNPNPNAGIESSNGLKKNSRETAQGQRYFWLRDADGPPAGLLDELRSRLGHPSGPWSLAFSSTSTSTSSSSSSSTSPSSTAPPTSSQSPAVVPSTASTAESAPSKSNASSSSASKQRPTLAEAYAHAETLETLEMLLVTKRKALRAGMRAASATGMPNKEESSEGQGIGGVRKGIRQGVREMCEIYTQGQATILDQAVEWTRAQLEELVDLIDSLEEAEEEEDAEGADAEGSEEMDGVQK